MKTNIIILAFLSLFIANSQAQSHRKWQPSEFRVPLGKSEVVKQPVTRADGTKTIALPRNNGTAYVTMIRGEITAVVVELEGKRMPLKLDGKIGLETTWSQTAPSQIKVIVLAPAEGSSKDPCYMTIRLDPEG